MITSLIYDRFVWFPAYSWQKTAEYPESLENTNYFQERNFVNWKSKFHNNEEKTNGWFKSYKSSLYPIVGEDIRTFLFSYS